MRKGYDSLLGIVQKTLQPNKPNPVTIVNANGKAESRFNNKLAGLEKMVANRIGKLETEVNDGAAAGSETQNAKQAIENLKANIALLDTKLRETEEIVREKGTTIRRLEQNSAARIQDLESQMKTKDNLLVGRATEVSDLKTQLEALKNWIKEMSSFFNQSEILATVKGQDNDPVICKGESKTRQDKPAATRFTGSTATSEVTDAAVEAVPPIFFDDMTRELTEFCGPMASVIIHDHVASLGESTGKFPKARVPELLEIISREIPYESVKNSFRERLVGSPEKWDIGSFEKWVKGDVFFF